MDMYKEIDPWVLVEERSDLLISKLKDYLERTLEVSGKNGYVIGLSGGLDSSTLAVLIRKTLGKEKLLALIMPDKDTNIDEVNDAINIAETFDINYLVLDISSVVDSMLNLLGLDRNSVEKIALGNIKARLRMVILYYYANSKNLLVASTTNRSEYLLGYFTKWGDIAGDVHPFLHLYKTQVRTLGKKLGLPGNLITKPSTPGFWPGHKSEDELGAPYDVIDKILYLAIDKQRPLEEIAKQINIDIEIINSIWSRVINSQHKRRISAPPFYSVILREDVEHILKGLDTSRE